MNHEQMIEKHEALQLDMLGTIERLQAEKEELQATVERLQAELDAVKNK